MKKALHIACLAALPLALAACQGEKKAAQQGTAQGEILPGSASDAMLPYDTVRSQPPLAPMPMAGGKAGAKAKGGEAGVEGSEAAAEASTAPAPTPEAPEPKAAQ